MRVGKGGYDLGECFFLLVLGFVYRGGDVKVEWTWKAKGLPTSTPPGADVYGWRTTIGRKKFWMSGA
jgi:hypothetical protein